ncbi:MAG: hypothetical protein JNM36_16790 [Chitinophagales bacterium]|nr:hypothetical protein [Chitinophagales bacterium]
MKKLLCSCLFVLLGSASLSAQIMVSLHYPMDSITIIDPLQELPNVVAVDITFTEPSRGVVTLLADNTLRYVANSMTEVAYSDWFDITVFDGTNSYNRYVNITPVFDESVPNVPPLGGIYWQQMCRDKAYPYPPSFPLAIKDFNYDDLNYTLLQNALHGMATIVNTNLSNYELIYQPNAGFIGVDTIVYRACEIYTTEQYCVDVLQTIYVADCAESSLVANNYSYYQRLISTDTFTPLENDYADNLPVTIHIVSQATWGDVVVNPDNSITYHAYNADTAITDRFTYQISDALGNYSDTATIVVTNVPPIGLPIDPIYDIVPTPANKSVKLGFLSTLLHDKSGTCIGLINSLLHCGKICINARGKYNYTPFVGLVVPKKNQASLEEIQYGICSANSEQTRSKVRVGITFPACNEDTVTVTHQKPTYVAVLDNDLSAEPLRITSVDMYPRYGECKIKDNQLVYTPYKSYKGYDSLLYRACDPYNNCDVTKVFIKMAADSTTVH